MTPIQIPIQIRQKELKMKVQSLKTIYKATPGDDAYIPKTSDNQHFYVDFSILPPGDYILTSESEDGNVVTFSQNDAPTVPVWSTMGCQLAYLLQEGLLTITQGGIEDFEENPEVIAYFHEEAEASEAPTLEGMRLKFQFGAQ